MSDKREAFFASLTDEQTGFYYAFENAANLEDLLQEELTAKQFILYKDWIDSGVEGPTDDIAESTSTNLFVEQLAIEKSVQTENKEAASTRQRTKSQAEELELSIRSAFSETLTTTSKRLSNLEANVNDINERTKLMTTDKELLKIGATVNEINERTKVICSNDLPLTVNVAKRWCKELAKEIESRSTANEKASIGTKENIRTVIQVLTRFPSNDEVQASCCLMLHKISSFSTVTRQYLIEVGGLQYILEIFKSSWRERNQKEALLKDIIQVALNISMDRTVRKSLMERNILKILLGPLNSEFTEFAVISTYIFIDLIILSDFDWKSRNVMNLKSDIVDYICKCFPTWEVGIAAPRVFSSLSWHLDKLRTGSKVLKIYSAWLIANQITLNTWKQNEPLKADGILAILEDAVADADVENHCKKAIERLKTWRLF